MTLRLFAAISLPDEVADRLELLQRDIHGTQWREREALHLTLAFYGDVSVPTAKELDELIAQIRLAPFELSLAGVGWFGRKEPTALWADVKPSEPLLKLASRCERAGRSLGLELPSRTYRPHVTLAYCGGTSVQEAAAYQNEMRGFRTEAFTVEQFELYSSHRTRGQNRYDEEATYPLVGP